MENLDVLSKKLNHDILILEFNVEDAGEILAMMFKPWLPKVCSRRASLVRIHTESLFGRDLGKLLGPFRIWLLPLNSFSLLQSVKRAAFSWVIRKEKKPQILQTYKGMRGEETGILLSVCSNTMLAHGVWGNATFSSVFWMICFDSVHNNLHMLNCKDLTFVKGMKGSESSSGMWTVSCREQFGVSKWKLRALVLFESDGFL